MLVWSTPASNYFDPDYCNNTQHGCDIEMTKQEAIWVNAFSYLGCIFSVPFAGWFAPPLSVYLGIWDRIILRVLNGEDRQKGYNDSSGIPICFRKPFN